MWTALLGLIVITLAGSILARIVYRKMHSARLSRVVAEWQRKCEHTTEEESVVIIGAGIAGIAAGVKLQESGIAFRILEKKNDVGGTWLDNIYPGSGCDVPSFLYSFSFMPNAWSHKWAGQEEILQYVQRIARRYGLYNQIQFSTEVCECIWNEEEALWTLRGPQNRIITRARWMICSTGQLNYPNIPPIPGRDLFRGPSFHSAEWDYSVDLKGKKIAVVGNGASAIQFIPPISKDAAELFIFQRTPSYVWDKNDFAYPAAVLWMFKNIPGAGLCYRWYLYLTYEMLWPLVQNGWLNRTLSKVALNDMRKKIPDQELSKKIVPQYLAGCKRILISNEYIPTLHQDHVHLIPHTVDSIQQDGVVSQGASYPVDVIIYATGFRSAQFLFPMIIHGRNGKQLEEVWEGRPRAYWGMTVPSMPNLFITYGPSTNLAHNSIIFMVECQVEYITRAIRESQQKGVRSIDVAEEKMNAFDEACTKAMKNIVFSTDCGGWYKTATGEIVNNSPFSTIYYWWNTCIRGFSFADYSVTK